MNKTDERIEKIAEFVKVRAHYTRAPVPTWVIRDHMRERHRVFYDQVDAALSKAVRTGRLVKPKRGFYLPGDES